MTEQLAKDSGKAAEGHGKYSAHVAQHKKDTVERIMNLINDYRIIGVVNMENLPAPQLQSMRAKLRDSAVLLMTKRRLINIAIENSKNGRKGVEQLELYLSGMPALLFTKDNPFKLSKLLKKNKSPAPAKPGQIAPNDIVVSKGATPFAPGPIIGELAVLGIKSGVEAGKVAIKEDSIVARKGEKIKGAVAGILTRLGIMPMEVGLDLVAAYEDGIIYSKAVLSIDEQEYIDKIENAARWAFNLAFNSDYPTSETLLLLIGKAFRESKSVGLEASLFEKGIIEELISKAEREMLNLKNIANIPIGEPKAEEKSEEKSEEKQQLHQQQEIKKEIIKEQQSIQAPTMKELEENIEKRDKEKEMKEVERLAQEIARKHALGNNSIKTDN